DDDGLGGGARGRQAGAERDGERDQPCPRAAHLRTRRTALVRAAFALPAVAVNVTFTRLPAARRVGFTLKSCFAAAPASSAPSLRHDLPATFALRFATFAHTRALPAADSPVLRTLTRSATARFALTRL